MILKPNIQYPCLAGRQAISKKSFIAIIKKYLVGVWILGFGISISFSQPAFAGFFDLSNYHTYGPLTTRTQNPLYLLFLSGELERTSTLPKGQFSFDLETSFSNLFEYDPRAAGIGVDLDMEMIRTAFRAGYGLTNRLELGLEIPFLSFSAGFMDTFIQGYHNAFGFPNGGRNLVDNGRFSYRVTQNGNTLYQVDQSDFGMSDIILWQKFKIFDETKWIPAIAARGALKIPSGRASEGTGSNRPDFGMTLLLEKSYKRLHSYSQIGFVMLGGHPQLNLILKNGAAIFGQAFELNVTEHLSFIGQISGNTAIFKNVQISELSDAVFDLTFGFRGEVPFKKKIKKIKYQFAFTEDPRATDASVDFSLFFKVGLEY